MLPKAIPVDSDEAAHFIACHTLPLAIKEDAAHPPYQVISRATFSLIEIAKQHYFVTSAHVYEKYLEVKAAHPGAQLAAYSTEPYFMELHGFRLIDWDSKNLDIAIFGGQENRVELPSRLFIPYEASYLTDPEI